MSLPSNAHFAQNKGESHSPHKMMDDSPLRLGPYIVNERRLLSPPLPPPYIVATLDPVCSVPSTWRCLINTSPAPAWAKAQSAATFRSQCSVHRAQGFHNRPGPSARYQESIPRRNAGAYQSWTEMKDQGRW